MSDKESKEYLASQQAILLEARNKYVAAVRNLCLGTGSAQELVKEWNMAYRTFAQTVRTIGFGMQDETNGIMAWDGANVCLQITL